MSEEDAHYKAATEAELRRVTHALARERERAEKAEAALADHRKRIWMPLSVREGMQSPEDWYEAGERIKERFQNEREEWRARAERYREALRRILHTVETSVPYTPPEGMGPLWMLVRQDARRALSDEQADPKVG